MRFAFILIILLVGCKKFVPEKPHERKIKCDFGVKEFSLFKRHFPKPKDTVIIIPPPEPTQGNVLYLDFDGELICQTTWNNLTAGAAFTVSPSGLTSEEINYVVSRVTNAFAGKNVTVTANRATYDSATRRSMCVFTESWEWFGQAGGTAFVGSFGTNNPCFVFTSLLGYNPTYIGEAGCHEFGHTLGLYHQSTWVDCVKTEEYRPGPIMGISYYSAPGGWTIGTSSQSCTKIQDDEFIISQTLQ